MTNVQSNSMVPSGVGGENKGTWEWGLQEPLFTCVLCGGGGQMNVLPPFYKCVY